MELLKIIILFLSAIASLSTCIMAIKAYRAFAKNALKTKQVESMCDLVKYLNSKLLKVGYVSYDVFGIKISTNDILFNIFEIGSLNDGRSLRDFDEPEYNASPVYLDKQSNDILDIKEFIDNSFIPSPIANKLRRFYVARTELNSFEKVKQSKLICVITSVALFFK